MKNPWIKAISSNVAFLLGERIELLSEKCGTLAWQAKLIGMNDSQVIIKYDDGSWQRFDRELIEMRKYTGAL